MLKLIICSISGDTIKLFITLKKKHSCGYRCMYLSLSFHRWRLLNYSSTLVRTPLGRCFYKFSLDWLKPKYLKVLIGKPNLDTIYKYWSNQSYMYQFLSVEVLLKSLPILVIHPTTRLSINANSCAKFQVIGYIEPLRIRL